MGVERVSVAEALSHADTLEICCCPIRVLLPAQESMENKRHTSNRCYSTNIYIQNHWSTALKLLWKTARTQIVLSPETPWKLYNYIYLEDNTPYGAKYWWYNEAQNKNQKTPKTCNTVCYSVSNKQKPSTIPSRKCNNCIWASVVQLPAKISERHRKCQNWKIQIWARLVSGAHSWSAKKCPTMSPHQEATASSTSYSSEGSRNLPKGWSLRLGHGAVLAASKPI